MTNEPRRQELLNTITKAGQSLFALGWLNIIAFSVLWVVFGIIIHNGGNLTAAGFGTWHKYPTLAVVATIAEFVLSCAQISFAHQISKHPSHEKTLTYIKQLYLISGLSSVLALLFNSAVPLLLLIALYQLTQANKACVELSSLTPAAPTNELPSQPNAPTHQLSVSKYKRSLFTKLFDFGHQRKGEEIGGFWFFYETMITAFSWFIGLVILKNPHYLGLDLIDSNNIFISLFGMANFFSTSTTFIIAPLLVLVISLAILIQKRQVTVANTLVAIASALLTIVASPLLGMIMPALLLSTLKNNRPTSPA